MCVLKAQMYDFLEYKSKHDNLVKYADGRFARTDEGQFDDA